MLSCCSTPENHQLLRERVGVIGEVGSWFCNCVVKTLRRRIEVPVVLPVEEAPEPFSPFETLFAICASAAVVAFWLEVTSGVSKLEFEGGAMGVVMIVSLKRAY